MMMETTENTPEQARDKAQKLLEQGEIQAAADILWKTARSHSKDTATWHMFANIYRDYGNRFTDAERAYKKALKLDSTNSAIHADFGLHCFKFRRLEEAQWHLNRAIKLSKTPWWTHRTYGLLLKQQYKYDKSQESPAIAKYLQPNDPVTLFGLCALYVCRGDIEKALEHLEAYLDTVDLPDHVCATLRTMVTEDDKTYLTWSGLGEETFYARRFTEARDAAYTGACRFNNASMWCLVYKIEDQQGLDLLADLALSKALEADAYHKETMRLNAIQYVNMGLHYEAQTRLLQYLERYPDDEEMRYHLEEVYDRMDAFAARMMDNGYYA